MVTALVAAAGLAAGAAAAAAPAAAGTPVAGTSEAAAWTAHGDEAAGPATPRPAGAGAPAPITAADRDLVVRVRLAGLWEMPAGEMATAKGAAPRVREIGTLIMEQHERLDEIDREAAARLGVRLPDEPNAEQQYWLREMRAAEGKTFDRVFVQRLREAHGKIFPAIAIVRANTRNAVVRGLADQANEFVKTHLQLLESTGIVDYARLPDLAEPAPDEKRFVHFGDPRYAAGDRLREAVVLALLGLAVALGAVLGIRVVAPGLGTRVARPAAPAPPHRRHRPAAPPVVDRTPSRT